MIALPYRCSTFANLTAVAGVWLPAISGVSIQMPVAREKVINLMYLLKKKFLGGDLLI